jgi:peptidyl-prolyl cis-trans isomerase D
VLGYEQQQRRQGAVDQLMNGFAQSAFVAPNSVDSAWKLLGQRRKATYTTLELDQFLDQVEISEASIAEEYQSNRDAYFKPAEVRIEYLKLSVEELGEDLESDESELRGVYDENPERFVQPGSRSASHILIKIEQGADENVVDQARVNATEIATRARAGESFSELAKRYSEDPGSAGLGGTLGIVRPGTMVKPFEDAVFSLREGDISDPVRTEYGFHVIQLDKVTESRVQPFDQVREEIGKEVRRLRAEEQFNELAEVFGNVVFEQPDSLDPAAEQVGLGLKRSGWFALNNGKGIASAKAVRDAAFNDEVLVDGLNSELIELDADTLVALRKLDYRERRQLSLAEAKPEIEKLLRDQKASAAMDIEGQALLDQLGSGADWDQLLRDKQLGSVKLPENEEGLVEPLEQAIAAQVYELAAPDSGAVSYGGERISPARFAIFRLERVVYGDPAMMSDEQRLAVERLLLARRGNELILGWRRGLRQRANVQINEEQL